MFIHSFSSIGMFENCPQRFYRQRILRDVVDVGGVAAEYGTHVHRQLEERLRDKKPLKDIELRQYEAICTAIESMAATLHTEVAIAITQDLKPVPFDSDKAFLRGILDLVIRTHKGKYLILDWKTGKYRPGSWQLKLSALLYMCCNDTVDELSTGYVWLKANKIEKAKFSRDDVPGLIKEIFAKAFSVQRAIDTKKFVYKPGPLCRFCPAKNTCSHAQL